MTAAAAESKGALALRESHAMSTDPGGALTGAQLKFISNTDFVPSGLRGNMPAILACVATGRALGLADMTALRSIHIIDGKATFSAELMVMLARKAGHSIVGTTSASKVTVTGTRDDNGDTMTAEWTLEDAERIGLLNKPNWKKYPEDMLWARAASALCRRLFADCFAGASYTPEELGAGDVTADELLHEEPSQDPPAAGASPPEPPPPADTSDEVEGEVVDEEDEPGPITQQQKDRLLELVAQEKLPNVGPLLTERIKTEYGAATYNALTEPQMDELLGWLEEQAA